MSVDRFMQHKGWYVSEGTSGLKNLCRLVRVLGYKDPLHYGQFDHDGAFGDLFTFLEDNSGAMHAITDWIEDQIENGGVDSEWREAIESELPVDEEECPDCGEPTYGELHSCPID